MFFEIVQALFKRSTESDIRTYDAVILIDMQCGFMNQLRQNTRSALIKNQQSVIMVCRVADIPICVLEYIDHGETISKLTKKLKCVPRVKTIQKFHDDGFRDTELGSVLENWGVRNILLMGINAEYCVKETAKSALKRGYSIMTAPGLISGSVHHDPTDCIKWYKQNGTLIQI